MALCPILKGECVGKKCEWWYPRAENCVIRLSPKAYLAPSDTSEDCRTEDVTVK